MNLKEYLILYVDDERSNRVVFEQSFRGRFRIKTAESAAAALEVLEQETVAVLITDQRMPELQGGDLLAKAKQLYPDAVRMVITAYSDLDPILRAVNEGLVARYLNKPWDRVELEQVLLWAVEAYMIGQQGSALQTRLLQTERLVTLGSIAAAVAHDLKRPLSHFEGNTSRLRQLSETIAPLSVAARLDDLGAKERGAITDVAVELPAIALELLEGCRTMSEVLRSMQMLIHPEEPPPEGIDPLPSIEYAMSVCRDAVLRAAATIRYVGPASLPSVRIGSTALSRVLINLAANAADALVGRSAPGGCIEIGGSTTGQHVRFVVRDDGEGMSAAHLGKMGTPFFSTRKEGTGIGVAQCRRLIAAAHGELTFESAEGVGTTATFTVPCA